MPDQEKAEEQTNLLDNPAISKEVRDELSKKEEPKEEPKAKEPDKFDLLTEKVDSLTDAISQYAKKQPVSAQLIPDVTPSAPQKEEVPDADQYWADPIGYAEKRESIMMDKITGEIKKILDPMKENAFNAKLETVKAKNKDFAKYEDQFNTLVTQYPQIKDNPEMAEKAFMLVKASNIKDMKAEIIKEYEEEKLNKTVGSLDSPSAPAQRTEKAVLTPEQMLMAEKTMPDLTREKAHEEYAKWMS